jgi:hypothetical protein
MNLIQIIIPVVAVVWQEGGMVKSEPIGSVGGDQGGEQPNSG